MEAATPHLTQFPAEIHQLIAMTDEQLNKYMDDPQHQWWTEPMTLIFGKSVGEDGSSRRSSETPNSTCVSGEQTEIVEQPRIVRIPWYSGPLGGRATITTGGVWNFYEKFRAAHGLRPRLSPMVPEIEVKNGSLLTVPFRVITDSWGGGAISITVAAPDRWKVVSGEGTLLLPGDDSRDLRVEVETPELSKEELQKEEARAVVVRISTEGKTMGEVGLRVLLKASALPQ
jgi:hypothetical protein